MIDSKTAKEVVSKHLPQTFLLDLLENGFSYTFQYFPNYLFIHIAHKNRFSSYTLDYNTIESLQNEETLTPFLEGAISHCISLLTEYSNTI